MSGTNVDEFQLVAMILLGLALVPIAMVIWSHVKRFSFLRMVMLLSYLAAILLTFATLLIKPLGLKIDEYYVIIVFNLAGQIIAATGSVESCQFLYNFRKLSNNTSSTRRKFIIVWVVIAVVLVLIFPVYALRAAPLLSYRCLSLFLINVETLLYTVVYCTLPNDNVAYGIARVYYFSTIFCRLGITLGILLRMFGGTKLGIYSIHYAAVLVLLLTLSVHSSWGKSILRCLTGASKRTNKRQSTNVSGSSRPKGTKLTKVLVRTTNTETPTFTPHMSRDNLARGRSSTAALTTKLGERKGSMIPDTPTSKSGGSIAQRPAETFFPGPSARDVMNNPQMSSRSDLRASAALTRNSTTHGRDASRIPLD